MNYWLFELLHVVPRAIVQNFKQLIVQKVNSSNGSSANAIAPKTLFNEFNSVRPIPIIESIQKIDIVSVMNVILGLLDAFNSNNDLKLFYWISKESKNESFKNRNNDDDDPYLYNKCNQNFYLFYTVKP